MICDANANCIDRTLTHVCATPIQPFNCYWRNDGIITIFIVVAPKANDGYFGLGNQLTVRCVRFLVPNTQRHASFAWFMVGRRYKLPSSTATHGIIAPGDGESWLWLLAVLRINWFSILSSCIFVVVVLLYSFIVRNMTATSIDHSTVAMVRRRESVHAINMEPL